MMIRKLYSAPSAVVKVPIHYLLFLISVALLAACDQIPRQAASAKQCATQTGELRIGDMVSIPEGKFKMGSENFYPEEGPVREVSVSSFEIGANEVTNAQFEQFVNETQYVTVAERPLNPREFPNLKADELKPGALIFAPQADITNLSDFTKWWTWQAGANWRHPGGPNTNIIGLENHPVVQIAYEDALEYAKWAKADLPTEAQWERAARGGLVGLDYVWDNQRSESSGHEVKSATMANHWQGIFPIQNTKEDGYQGTSPVGCFARNNYGLYDVAGNVWELTKDDYSDVNGLQKGMKAARGGSFLCSDNYCGRYRPAARTPVDIYSGMQHVGFRIVRNRP